MTSSTMNGRATLLARAMMDEVLAAMLRGEVPVGTRTFAELHDHLDANLLGASVLDQVGGALPDPDDASPEADWQREVSADLFNMASTVVDAMLGDLRMAALGWTKHVNLGVGGLSAGVTQYTRTTRFGVAVITRSPGGTYSVDCEGQMGAWGFEDLEDAVLLVDSGFDRAAYAAAGGRTA